MNILTNQLIKMPVPSQPPLYAHPQAVMLQTICIQIEQNSELESAYNLKFLINKNSVNCLRN